MEREGSNRTKSVLNVLMAGTAIGICVLEQEIPADLLFRYMLLMCFNAGMAIVLNRTSVLKKKVWLLVIALCYIMAFIVGKFL